MTAIAPPEQGPDPVRWASGINPATDQTGTQPRVSLYGKNSAAGDTPVKVDASGNLGTSLPTGAATAAKQPALGTAGTPSADVLSVQGVASMTPLHTTDGGTTATAITAGTVADTVIKGSAGRLCRIVVTTAGTNAMEIYDNASAGSGKIIATVAANAVAGTWIDAQMPAANGITVKGNANNPAVTISFS
jgi:hypothetical protein